MACRKEGESFLLFKNTIKSDPEKKKENHIGEGELEREALPSL